MQIGIPQGIFLGLQFVGLGVSIAMHGKWKKESKHDFWVTLIVFGIDMWILTAGGFFK